MSPTTAEVNAWLETAVRWAGDYRARPDAHADIAVDVRAGFDALPVVLQPLALDRLLAFCAGANSATDRINGALVLEWVQR